MESGKKVRNQGEEGARERADLCGRGRSWFASEEGGDVLVRSHVVLGHRTGRETLENAYPFLLRTNMSLFRSAAQPLLRVSPLDCRSDERGD